MTVDMKTVPTYAEMLTGDTSHASPGSGLFGARFSWRKADGALDFAIVPSEMTGSTVPIVLVAARPWPLGTHQTGVAWSMFLERKIADAAALERPFFVGPADDFASGAAFVAQKLGIDLTVIAARDTRAEVRKELTQFGAKVIECDGDATRAASEAKAKALAVGGTALDPAHDFAAYRFHTTVTARPMIELAASLVKEHVGRGRIDAFIGGFDDPAMLAAGHTVKEAFPGAVVVAADDQAGLDRWTQAADTSRAWPLVLDPDLVDAAVGVDPKITLGYWQILAKHPKVLTEEAFVPMEHVDAIVDFFGYAAMQRLFAAVKFARARAWSHENLIMVVVPSALARDASILDAHVKSTPKLDFDGAVARIDWLRDTDAGGVVEFSPALRARRREQHKKSWIADGRSAADYDLLVNEKGWAGQRAAAADVDRAVAGLRG